jgi:sortase A
VLGAGLSLAGIGALGVGLGALLRNTAAAIATLTGLLFVVPPVVSALPDSWADAIGPYLPGAAGTAIITGHRDTHFAFLARVRAGDTLMMEVPGRTPVGFRVTETLVVDARTAAVLSDDGIAALVLVTCYPFDAVTAGGPLRYVVAAVRADM